MKNDDDNAVTAAPDKPASKADEYMAALNKRAAELQETGVSRWVALDMAELESRIAYWPPSWGDDLQVLIYGDFQAPDHDLDYPALGITVKAGRRTDTIIGSSGFVVG